jgi:hypothetical protein
MRRIYSPTRSYFDVPSSSQTMVERDPGSDEATISSPVPLNTPHRIRKPFKSPMGGEESVPKGSTTILDIQMLERRMQILKRAIKILAEEDDDTLEGLGQKWREKGREIANQLWTESSINAWETGNPTTSDQKPFFNDQDVQEEEIRSTIDRREEMDEESDEEKAENDVGTMLKVLGVPLQALGWGSTE